VNDYKFYTRRIPDDVQARALDADEIVYDGSGNPIPHHHGDILVTSPGRFTYYVMTPDLFHRIYMEVPDDAGAKHDKDVPQTELPDLQQR
jgi:hypothetical protein